MAEPARILIVDDDEDARDIATAILADGDLPGVTAVASADEAYALLGLDAPDDEAVPPAFDVVLLDIVMPLVDGIEICARIRATRRYRDVPILMVSGQRDAQSLTQAFVAGAHDYVAKPIDRTELLARVRSTLRLKRELDRRRTREADLISRNRALGATPAAAPTAVPYSEREQLERRIEALANVGADGALLAVSIRDLRPYAAEHGAAAAGALDRIVADLLARTPAPLGCTLAGCGDGLFLVLARGRDGEATLAALAETVRDLLAMRRIPHGNAADGDHVVVDCAIVAAGGTALLSAPARAIERARASAQSFGETA